MEFASLRPAGGHRTKKCGTCRDRKVKCDKQEPFCTTCTSRGYICKGYDPPVVFIPVQPGREHSRRSSGESSRSTARVMGRGQALLPMARQPVPASPSTWTPDQIWILREYFLLHLAGNATVSPGSGLPSLLCEFLGKSLPVGSLQYRCMKALTASYYLMRTAGPDACQRGKEAYGHAINAVRWAINHPHRKAEPDVLMSIMCLCLYENIIVTNPRTWIEHYKGVSTLIEMHSPDHYQSGKNREILLACRYTIIISAGTLRQPCFLAKPAWRQMIELNEAESRDVFDTILGIVVDVPGLLHGMDRLTDGTISNTELTTLSATLQWTVMALRDWWHTSFSAAGGNNDSLSIYSPHTASAIAFHHMVLLLLEELCYKLQVSWLPESSVPSNFPATPRLNETPTLFRRAWHKHSVASEILQLAQRSIGPDTGIYGILRFIMPLHVAHDHLLPGSLEMEALGNLMNVVMAGQHGFQMAKRHDGQYTSFPESLFRYEDWLA
ncbi:hypothetical protein BJX63DRAFT_374625 [Aspergillus granulosus]|uniref:Zn(2)-C6 fungal-type domain-containing protein n=1 Tax=Aspergillus granulosus TaxID=176169 RepID=A0ABR4H256_9EURO